MTRTRRTVAYPAPDRRNRICTGQGLNPQVAPSAQSATKENNHAKCSEQGGRQLWGHCREPDCPVEHVQASIDLIDGAISREASLGEPDTNNVIVLDDVTPQYLKASYALNTCSASLDTALKS
jgi:hypothetical protein